MCYCGVIVVCVCVCVWEERADIFSLRGYRQLNFGLAEVAAAAAAAARGGYVHRSIHSSSLFSASSVFVVPQRCSSTRFFHFLPSLIVTSNERVMCARLLWPYSLSLSFISALLHPRSSQCSAVQCSALLRRRREGKKPFAFAEGNQIDCLGNSSEARALAFISFYWCCAAAAALRLFRVSTGPPSNNSTRSFSSCSPFYYFTFFFFFFFFLQFVCVCVCVGAWCEVYSSWLIFFLFQWWIHVAGCWPLALGFWVSKYFHRGQEKEEGIFLFLACVCSHKSIKQEKRPPPPPQLSPFRYFIYSTYVRILAPRELRNDCSSSFFLLCYYIGVREAVESSTWSLRRKDPFPRFSFFFFFFFFFLCAIPSHCVASFKWLPFFIRPIHWSLQYLIRALRLRLVESLRAKAQTRTKRI